MGDAGGAAAKAAAGIASSLSSGKESDGSEDASGRLIDVSFVGSRLEIQGVWINNFMDDANPIEFQDIEPSQVEWSCNGKMIRTVKPGGLLFSVTVIPRSNSDTHLRRLLRLRYPNGGDMNLSLADEPISASLTVRQSHGSLVFKFDKGTIISGPIGFTANSDGKMQGNTYTFLFEKVTV